MLQSVPCPFLALSATVGNPMAFQRWLERCNRIKYPDGDKKVEHISYSERFNDLYKYIYVDGEIYNLHPMACLNYRNVKDSGISRDMPLTPREALLLYDAMKEVFPNDPEVKRLEPQAFFEESKALVLRKRDMRTYEVELKKWFVGLMRDGTMTEEYFNKIVRSFRNVRPQSHKALFEVGESKGEEGSDLAPKIAELGLSRTYLDPANLVQLCRKLDEMECLPL